MQTLLLDDIRTAAEILRSGGLVAFPTETVYGLGADARSEAAIERLFAAKGRPADNPLIVHLSAVEQWPLAARELTPVATRVLAAFAPGPVSVIVPKNDSICASVTAGLDTVGIRIPLAKETRELLRASGIPIAAPSANLSGKPSCTTWQSVYEDLCGRVDAILTLNVPHIGLESSVVDCTGEAPVLLRPGAVSLADLQRLIPASRQLVWREPQSGVSTSPGMRHPHYQPRAKVQLLKNSSDWTVPGDHRTAAYCGLDRPPAALGLAHHQQFESADDYAHGFYEFLRAADRLGVDLIFVQLLPEELSSRTGIAAALSDRQLRAAGVKQ